MTEEEETWCSSVSEKIRIGLVLQDAQNAFFQDLGRQDMRASRAAAMTGNALQADAETVLRGAQENARVSGFSPTSSRGRGGLLPL